MASTGEQSSTVLLVVAGGVEVPVWRGQSPLQPDLAVVDSLARLQLAARRRGWSIRLQNPGRRLRQLLELVGLAALLVEVEGEAKGRELLGVEEGVEADGPAV